MDYNKIFTVILLVFSIIGCNDVNYDKDIEIIRFEKQFYNSDEKQLDDLIEKYPYLFPNQFPKSTWINKINDSLEMDFYKNSLIEFKGYDFNSKKVKLIFNNAKSILQNFKTPKIITLISKSDFNDRIIYNEPYLFISLNLYFGSNYYENIPKYISKNMNKFFIPNDIAFKISERYIKSKDDRTLLSNMILFGKILYLNKLLNPEEEDYVIFNTTIKKMNWTNENEFEIWSYFVENEYFFNTDIDLRSRFMSLSPYSKFNLDIDKKSPGAIGRWLGYRIVDSYMKNNKIDLKELINLDHYTIFKKSKYKPYK
tara:strand:- start:23073 stop:24008 length:936 start_codon:yes stop_codon:yes gene_type:complete